jgi:hypothetical protein
MIKEKVYNSCKAGDLKSCRRFIKEGGDITSDENLAIRWISEGCNIGLIRRKLKNLKIIGTKKESKKK